MVYLRRRDSSGGILRFFLGLAKCQEKNHIFQWPNKYIENNWDKNGSDEAGLAK